MNEKNGTSRRRSFDRWFRYPAGFSPETLDRCFDAAGLRRGDLLLDPFAGVATAATSATARGIRFRGMEVHPLIAEVASLKLARPDAVTELDDLAKVIVDAAKPGQVNREASLVRRCFDEQTLRHLVGLRDRIERSRSPWRAHLRLVLLGILRDFASVKVGWPHQRPALARTPIRSDLKRAFRERASEVAEDLKRLDGSEDAIVRCVDSRSIDNWKLVLSGETADACITSPPYLNNFDYADATRLELYFFGHIVDWSDMCRSVRSGMVRSTTQQVTIGHAESSWAALKTLPNVFTELRGLAGAIEKERQHRSGFKRYGHLLPCYFADMRRVLKAAALSLRPAGRLVWVVGDSAPYGVHVDTPRLLSTIATSVGFRLESSQSVRSRGNRWTKAGTRHQVPLSESIICLTRRQ